MLGPVFFIGISRVLTAHKSGTIPAVVYYGLKFISPAMFLPLACILCALVGIALGSAWTVSATLGIAFMSIGATMGLNPGLVAGMVLSGACCGDKFSPLSDSPNLAAGSAQTGPCSRCT